MWDDDWLMRQINAFALGVAESIHGEPAQIQKEVDFEQLFGTDPAFLATMSEGSLLVMVQNEGRIEAQRALTMAVGIATVEAARPKAKTLLEAAVAADPDLRSVEIDALLEALDAPLH